MAMRSTNQMFQMNSGGGGMSMFGGNPGGMLPNSWDKVPGMYGQFGQDSRNANAAIINQVMAGYGQVFNQQAGALNRAAGFLRGTNQANIRDINKGFTKLSGQSIASMVSRGLGNSTIRDSIQTGIANARADALSRSRAEFGTRMYDAYSRNALANSSIATQALGFLGNVNVGYPDPSMASMSGYGGFPVAPGGGGGSLVVGDPNRPVGGFQPGWTHYGGASGVEPGPSGGGPMTAYGIKPVQPGLGSGPGFWEQSAGLVQDAWNQNYADIQPTFNYANAEEANNAQLMSLYADPMF